MYLIVGLGNPGKKYIRTRHNIGFRVLDYFRKENDFPNFILSKKFNSLISEKEFEGKKVFLVKPKTFMNNSGQAVKTLINFYKIARTGLIVIHDDIDICLGKIKIVKNRGSGGHKGVESIIRELKTKDFVRFRIGINQFAQNQKLTFVPRAFDRAQPRSSGRGKIKNQKLDEFVLKKFNREEEKILKEVIKKTSQALKIILVKSLDKAMAEFNI